MGFVETLAEHGFRRTEGHPSRGMELYKAQPNPFTTYSVHLYEDGTALFTWEFAIGEYMATRGIQFGSDETLNQFMFPREDERGLQEEAWLAGAIERARESLRSLRFDEPEASG